MLHTNSKININSLQINSSDLFSPFENEFNETTRQLNEDFLKPSLNSSASALEDITVFRKQEKSEFIKLGWPKRQMESWHYTDLESWLKMTPNLATENNDKSILNELSHLHKNLFVIRFEDGKLVSDLSQLPQGVAFTPFPNYCTDLHSPWGDTKKTLEKFSQLTTQLEKEHGGIIHLHQALSSKGFLLSVTAGAKISVPIIIEHHLTSQTTLPLHTFNQWVVLGEDSSLDLYEIQCNKAPFLSSFWNHFELHKSANLNLLRAQDPLERRQFNLLSFAQEQESQINSINFISGSGLIRESWVFDQIGENASLLWEGLNFAKNKDHIDVRTVINHRSPMGKSEQLSRNILAHQSRSIFNGKILIARGAQQVQTRQLSQNLVLDPQAEANTKPELEVYADNVKATHGATVGQLDQEQLYYLMSRGLTVHKAKELLLEGFCLSTLKLVPQKLQSFFHKWILLQLKNLTSKNRGSSL
ncbi:MAG: SufD family Fe-S cluster assembly protein [Bdellovibrionales bacterium]|nr:SufD family Fe-S cluster assembly protein [Bdellovibrionales bacterium]